MGKSVLVLSDLGYSLPYNTPDHPLKTPSMQLHVNQSSTNVVGATIERKKTTQVFILEFILQNILTNVGKSNNNLYTK